MSTQRRTVCCLAAGLLAWSAGGLRPTCSAAEQVPSLLELAFPGVILGSQSPLQPQDYVPLALAYARTWGNPKGVEVTFSAPVLQSAATSLTNYGISPGVTVQGAMMGSNAWSVMLTTTAMPSDVVHLLTVNGVQDLSSPPNLIAPNSQTPILKAQGVITRKVFLNVGNLSALTNSPNFPNSPDSLDYPASFESMVSQGGNHGTQIAGYIHPPYTGDYYFYLAAENPALLYLSPTANPNDKALIAVVTAPVSSRRWNALPGQQSTVVRLEAGRGYYLEALSAGGGGNRRLAAAWRMRGMPIPADGDPPIPGAVLSSLVPSGPVAIVDQPQDTTVPEVQGAVFSVAATGTPPYAYQWSRNGIPIPGAHAPTYAIARVGLADSGSAYSVVVSNGFSYAVSGNAKLTVTPDLTPPGVVAVSGSASMDKVRLGFSKPVELTTANDSSHYSLSGGLVVQQAHLQPDQTNVVLTTSPQSAGQNYTLTVAGVTDTTSMRNPANATTNFVAWVLSRGFLHRDVFLNIGGAAVADMTSNPRFPDSPDFANEIGSAEGPSSVADSYGQRVFGFLLPPVSGYYTFYIASDDQGMLYLSADDKALNKKLIALEPVWNPPRYWIGADRRNAAAPENRSAPVYLVAGQRYYLEALMKETSGGDNLAVTWQLPDDLPPSNGDPPIPGAYLACYANPSGATLAIAQQPGNATVAESGSTNFTLAVTASSSQIFYQWQKNGLDIPGANGATYNTPPLLRTDNGARYRCFVSIPGYGTNSAEASVSVVTDDVPPQVVSAATLVGSASVGIRFSEVMDPVTVAQPANYKLSNGGTVTGVTLRPDGQSVSLNVSLLSFTNYTVRLNGLKDYAGNSLPANTLATVSVLPWENTDVGTTGDPAVPGSTYSAAAGDFDVVGGGSYIWNNADHFQFVYQNFDGDFDVQVRISRLDRRDTWSAGGLIAREDLSPGSRFVFAAINPPDGANQYGTAYRSQTGGNAAGWPGPNSSPGVPLPNAWMRLRRLGDTFTAYRSTNGVDWASYAQITQPLAARLLVGLATVANNNGAGQATTVWFREFSMNTGVPLPVPLDLAIKKAADPTTAYVVNDVYQVTPTEAQVLMAPATTARPAAFTVKVENDGTASQSLVLRASETSEPGWKIRYRAGAADIGAPITSSAGYAVAELAAGASQEITLEMEPVYGLPGSATKHVTLSVRTDPYTRSLRDTVQAVAFNELLYQPDLQVRRLSDAIYAGTGVFNNNGAGQTKSLVVERGTSAVYPVRLVNAGNLTNQFVVTGSAASPGWTVRYFDAVTAGMDFTGEVTGGGAVVSLLPGASWEFRAELTPDASVSSGGTSDVLLTARSVANAGRVDAVRLLTTALVPSGIPQAASFATDADWERGTLVGAAYVNNELTVSDQPVTWPFIWIPNSNEGTVSKVDTRTGHELGRYRTCPAGVSGQPSRTTIDQYGNCWVGNRQSGTIVKIGLLENGQYIDRNTNGIPDVSQDLNHDGDITGSELLPWGQDECVLSEVILIPGKEGTFAPGTYTGGYVNNYWNPGPRGIAVDYLNNVWIGTHDTMRYYYIDGHDAVILRTNDMSALGHTAYGAVIDGHGILWSSGYKDSGQNNVLRLDPTDNSASVINFEFHTYGLGLDRHNHLFVSGHQESKLARIDVLTGTREWTVSAGYQSRGVAVTDDDDVWVACSSEGTVWRFSNNGVFKGKITVGATPTGVSVDADGKVWVVNDGDEYIHRIDPAIGIVGAIDLTKRIIGGLHYGYSDMTGIISRTATGHFGTWAVIHNSQIDYAQWGKITWNAFEPSGNNVTIHARSSNDGRAWSSWESVTNGVPLASTPAGKFLQLEVTLRARATDPSPTLSSLTIEPLPQRTAELAIGQTGLPSVVTNEHRFTWSLSATNSGPEDARGVFVDALLPPGVSVESVSNSLGTIVQTDPTLRCWIGNLPARTDFNMTVVAMVNTVGTLTNIFRVGHYEQDAVPGNNQVEVLAVAQPNPSATPPEGIVSWWPAEGDAKDLVGPNDGTLVNGAGFVPGKVGQAFSFNGNNQYVDCGRVSPGTHWSLEAWIKPTASQAGRIALFGCHADCRDWSLVLMTGQIALNRGLGGCVDYLYSGIKATNGVWYHVVGTCDGTNAFLYVNGELKSSGEVARNYVGSSGGLRIGSGVCCGEYFAGAVDEPTLYNRPLSAAEVFALYDAGSSGKTRSTFAPVLTIAPGAAAGTATVSWPAAATGFTLYFADTLGGTWQPVPASPTTPVGDQYVLVVTTDETTRFYRLQK